VAPDTLQQQTIYSSIDVSYDVKVITFTAVRCVFLSGNPHLSSTDMCFYL